MRDPWGALVALGDSFGRLGGLEWALWGSLGCPWAPPGGPSGSLGGPLGGLRGGTGGPRGEPWRPLLRKGGLTNSLVSSYELIHLGSRRLFGEPRVGQVRDQDGRRRGKWRPRRPQRTRKRRGRGLREKRSRKNVRRSSNGALQGGSFSKKYALVQARVVFLQIAREQKRRPKIAFTQRTSRQNGPQGALGGTLGDPWGALGEPFGGCRGPWGTPGLALETHFGKQAALQNQWFYNMNGYISAVRGTLGASSSRRLSTKAGPRRPLGGKGAPKAEGRQPREAQRRPKGPPRGSKEATPTSGPPSFGALGSVGGPLDMIYRKEKREKGEEGKGKGKVGRRDVY